MAVYKLKWSFWLGCGSAEGFVEADTSAEAIDAYQGGTEYIHIEKVHPERAKLDDYWKDRSSEPDEVELVSDNKSLDAYTMELELRKGLNEELARFGFEEHQMGLVFDG
jgi:hypothetical protein